MSSLSSISSVPSTAPGNYRGISGQIAANIQSLSNALRPLEQQYNEEEQRQQPQRMIIESALLGRPNLETEDPAILRAIREQMSLSLQHMKDLEDQVGLVQGGLGVWITLRSLPGPNKCYENKSLNKILQYSLGFRNFVRT